MALEFNPYTGNYYDPETGEYYDNQTAQQQVFGADATATGTYPYGNPYYTPQPAPGALDASAPKPEGTTAPTTDQPAPPAPAPGSPAPSATTDPSTTQTDSPLTGGLTTPPNIPISSDWPMLTLPPVPTIAPRETPAPFAYDPYQAGPDFSYDAFAAPTIQDAQNEPGYAFARDEGIKALENSKAAQGILRTGGTLKDILGWGDRFAEQNYGNVYTRAGQTYDRNQKNAFEGWSANALQRANAYTLNRNNAFSAWDANNGLGASVFDTNKNLAFDTYDRQAQAAQQMFAPKQRAAELTFEDMYRRFKAGLDATTAVAQGGLA